MKRDEHSFLDHSLRQIHNDESWDKNRQQQVRKQVFSEIDRNKSSKHSKRTGWTTRIVPAFALLLLLAVSSTLYLSETGTQESAPEQNSTNNDISAYSDSDQYSSGVQFSIDEESDEKIQDIQDSGFALRLPQNAPYAEIKAANIEKRKAMSGHSVTVPFMHQGDRVFYFKQESLNQEDQNQIGERKKEIKSKAVDQFNVNDYPGYITEKKADQENRNSVYIFTENYGFSIFSDHLDKDELVQIAQSINLSGLD